MKNHSEKHTKYLLAKSLKEIKKRQKANLSNKRKIKGSKLRKKKNKSIYAIKERKSQVWDNYLPPVEKPGNLEILGSTETVGAFPVCVFPFISLQNLNKGSDKYYKCEGTGCFIHNSGIFVTAKHVPIYKDKVLESFIAIHAHGNFVSVRHVKQFWINEDSDIAVGILDNKDVRNKLIYSKEMPYPHLIPNYNEVQIGQNVKNFGFGGSMIKDDTKRHQIGEFHHQWHEGPIRAIHPEGRGSWNKTGPEIEGEYDTIGLASGGPVFNETGELIGINSSSMPVYIEGDSPFSIFTPISEILDIVIDHPLFGKVAIKDLS